MEAEGPWRREEKRGSGCLDPDASSTALTAPLQCLTLDSAFSCSTLLRPLSLSRPPSSIGGDEPFRRCSLEAPCRGHSSVDGPRSECRTPPEPRRSPPKPPRRLRAKTTWHPNTGHWTWTAAALRAGPSRAAGIARTRTGKCHDRRTRERRATDATTALLRHDVQVRRLSMLERELDLQRRIRSVCEATDLSVVSEGEDSTL